MPRFAALLLAPLAAWAQSTPIEPHGTQVKASADLYEVKTPLGDHTLAADYLVRTFGGENAFFTEEFLIVEAALFGPRGKPVKIETRNFQLRLNGKPKETILAAAPSMVGSAIKWSDWALRRNLEAYGGVGDAGVSVGQPRPQSRFPGDPSARGQGPSVTSTDENVISKDPGRAAVYFAMPDGEFTLPLSGLLYFSWNGKPSKLKSVELLYKGALGEFTLKLK